MATLTRYNNFKSLKQSPAAKRKSSENASTQPLKEIEKFILLLRKKKKSFPVTLKVAVLFFLSFSKKDCSSQPYPPIPATKAYFYQTAPHPNNNATTWGGSDWVPNGIGHTDNSWVICSIEREPYILVGNFNYRIWKIPVSYDLVSQSNAAGVTSFDLQASNVDTIFKKYGHAGDLDVCTSPLNNGSFIVVPLTSSLGAPYTDNPIIGFFKATNLEYVNYAKVGTGAVGWCAVSPGGLFLYTSDHTTNEIRKYKIHWNYILNHPNNHEDGLELVEPSMGLLDEWGESLTLTDMQGGEFTEDGELLYISTGVMDCNPSDGLHIFRKVNNSWKRVKHSGNPLSPPVSESCFQLPQDCSWNPLAFENEGLTIWNINDGQAPGITRSSLHVLQVNHNLWSSSKETIRHYQSKSAGSNIFEGMAPATAYTYSQISNLVMHKALTGDLNGDNKTDIIFPCYDSIHGLTIKTQISNGNGTFNSYTDVMSDGNVVFQYPTLTGDINRDGKTDLIFIFPSPGSGGLTVRTKMSNGNGQFTSYEDYIGDGSVVFQKPALTGDVNGDGKTDLIFIFQSSGSGGLTIRTKMSNGNGQFTSYEDYIGDGSVVFQKPALTGDINGDGKTDLIFIFQSPSSGGLTIRTKMSVGNGQFTSHEDYIGDGSSVFQYPALTGDVNGDGKTDLIFTFPGSSSDGLTIRTKMSVGNGQFISYEDYIGDGTSVFQNPVLTGDVDADGKTDLVFVGQNWDGCGLNIRVKRSNGDGTWCGKWQVAGDIPDVHMFPTLTGDINGGGKTDLIFTFYGVPHPGFVINTKISQFPSYAECSPLKVYYRTRQSGNWNDRNTWEISATANFTSEIKSPAPLTPDISNAKSVVIRNGHNVVVTESVTTVKTFVNTAASLHVLTGVNFKIVE